MERKVPITTVRAVLIQMKVVDDKSANLRAAVQAVGDGARQGAQMVVLPEMFNCPYHTQNFPRYAEPQGGPAWSALSEAARRHHVVLVGGSMPEVDAAGKV